MTHSEIKRFRDRLEAARARLRGMVSTLQDEALRPVGHNETSGLSDLPRHNADRSNDEFAEDVALEVLENEGHLLEEVEAALARLDAGNFSLCTACGAAIGRERLIALPHASHCRHCEALEETAAAP